MIPTDSESALLDLVGYLVGRLGGDVSITEDDFGAFFTNKDLHIDIAPDGGSVRFVVVELDEEA